MKKLIFLFALCLFAFAKDVKAQYYNPPEENLQIVVDKKIKGLKEAVWKDNYPSDFMAFGPNTQFEFQITVKNTGNRNLTWIKVGDTLPSSLVYLYGREGTKVDGRSLTWEIPEIKPGEEQVTVIGVRTKDASALPSFLKEWANRVCVRAESNTSDCDESRFFTNMGKAGEKLPETGASLPLLGTLIGTNLLTLSYLGRRLLRGF